MAASADSPASPLRRSDWRGRSGRRYALIAEALDRFALSNEDLHVIAKGSLVLWVGSAEDLVADPLSRSRFRLALDCADRAYRLADPMAEASRLTTIWDLEGAEPVTEAAVAA